jgi:hypothetical protein
MFAAKGLHFPRAGSVIATPSPEARHRRTASVLKCALFQPTAAAAAAAAAYLLTANCAYVVRRSRLHTRLSTKDVVRMHLTRDGMSLPHFLACLLAWQCFVAFIWPPLELGCRVANHASFFYYYSKAGGMGIVLEPLNCMHLPGGKRRKYQTRLDWHQIPINIGPCARNGFRHPPTIRRNLPHIDVPRLGVRHWPWRNIVSAKCEDCAQSKKEAQTVEDGAATAKRRKRKGAASLKAASKGPSTERQGSDEEAPVASAPAAT